MMNTTKKNIDYWSIGFDFALPLILDSLIFKGTKGRVFKLLSTFAAQKAIRVLSQSKQVDEILDLVENWLKDEPKAAKTYPSHFEAIDANDKKPLFRFTRPQDYYDPEREIFN